MHSTLPFTTLILFFLLACNNDSSREIELLKEDLAKKEQPILELEEDLNNKENVSPENELESKHELRYLFYANSGMIAYFDDGTVVACPKCDFISSNILTMFEDEAIATYEVQKDGSLLLDNGEVLNPQIDENKLDNWPLIDFEWNEKVPQQ